MTRCEKNEKKHKIESGNDDEMRNGEKEHKIED